MSTVISSLENGLRIISSQFKSLETVALGAWINVGTRDEIPELNGISHILEHMAFKGTKRRNAFAIASEIESVGGSLNAYTSRENTFYYAKVMKEDLELAIGLISDIIQNSVMDEAELIKEKAVILQEIAQNYDTPDEIIFDYFQEYAYPNQAMGRPILGSKELVKSVSSKGLQDFINSYYCPSQIIISAAGNIDHTKLVGFTKTHFGSMSKKCDKFREPPTYNGSYFEEQRNFEQVHILLGLDGVSYIDNNFFPALAFSTLFGGGMTSRLFQEVREKRGLAYSIYSFLSSYSDSGLFGIYVGTSADSIHNILPLIETEFQKVIDNIGSQELQRVKAQLSASFLMAIENPSNLCEQQARQLCFHGRKIPKSETLAKIRGVTKSDIKKIAEKIFKTKLTKVSIGPKTNLGEFNNLRN